jgi:hypothetical protein
MCTRHFKHGCANGMWNTEAPNSDLATPTGEPVALGPISQAPPVQSSLEWHGPQVCLALCNAPWNQQVGTPVEPPHKKQKRSHANLETMGRPTSEGRHEPIDSRAPEWVAGVHALIQASGQATDAIASFSVFCNTYSSELGCLPNVGMPIPSRAGELYVSDVAVTAYLHSLQAGLSMATVYNKFASLKAGFRNLNLHRGMLPRWSEPSASAPPLVQKFFREAKKAAAREEQVVVERGFITSEQVLAYALHIVVKDMASEACKAEIVDALMLWVMAGRSHRLTNLQKTKWCDVGQVSMASGSSEVAPAPDQPFMNLAATKLLGCMSAKQLAETHIVVKFYLGDPVSQYLYNAHLDSTPLDIKGDPDMHFFPHKGPSELDFSRPVSNQSVKSAVLACAYHLGLVHNDEHAETFDCNSIRRGVAADVTQLLKDALGKLNLKHGRREGSLTGILVYTPRSVVVQPGLLHTDVGSIQEAFDNKVSEHVQRMRATLLCTTCGYPACQCSKCACVARGGKGKGAGSKHCCWLGGRRKGKHAKNSADETEQQFEARLQAWTTFGVDDAPVRRDGRFLFAE